MPTSSYHAAQSDPLQNSQFRRRWGEPPLSASERAFLVQLQRQQARAAATTARRPVTLLSVAAAMPRDVIKELGGKAYIYQLVAGLPQ